MTVVNPEILQSMTLRNSHEFLQGLMYIILLSLLFYDSEKVNRIEILCIF